MAITYSDYTGDGSNTDFAFSFPYLEDTHVVVEVDGVDKTTTAGDFTLPTTSLARMAVAPALAAAVRVRRVSDYATDLVDFTNGSVLTEGDLDRAYQHNRYLNEEAAEGNDASMQIVGGGTDFNAESKKIVNLAEPTLTTDATNKDYVDTKVALSGTNLNGFESSAHTGDNSAVDFTLSFTPQVSTPEAFLVTIDGVVQKPTTAYTIHPDTPKITFTSAPPTSAVINVVAISKSSTSAGSTLVKTTGSSAERSLANRFAEVVNVLDYGVKNDGTEPSGNSNAVRIQALIDGLSARNSTTNYTGGGTVFFPSGKYTVDDTIYVNSGVRLLGTLASPSFAFDDVTAAGSATQGTQIYGNFSIDKVLIDFSGKDSGGNHPSATTVVTTTAYNNVQGASITNIRLKGTSNVLTGIRLAHAPGCHVDNCEVWAGKYGIVVNFSWGCSIRNVNILVGDVGLALTSVNNIQVDNAYITGSTGMASTPYFYYTGDQGVENVYLNPTPSLSQSACVYTYYSSGVFNNLITEGADIGVNFRNSGFTLNTPYGENLRDYWMLAYSSRIIANSWTGGAIGSGAITGVTITNGGSGYSAPPTVAFTGGGGSGAAGYAVLNVSNEVESVVITNGGSGYSATPTVTFTGGGGLGATGTVIINTQGQYASVGNLMYCCAGAHIDLSINTTSLGNFTEYFQYHDDTLGAPAQVLIKGTTKGSTHNNYKHVKYEWERQNGQLKFLSSANSSSDVNTLDDYEEGTFTPAIRENGTGVAWTTSSVKGTYTKIGDTVFVTINVAWTVKQGVVTYYAYLAGLPFAPSATTEWVVATVIGGGTDMYHISLTTAGYGQFYKNNAAGTSGPLQTNELGGATGTLSVSFTYKI